MRALRKSVTTRAIGRAQAFRSISSEAEDGQGEGRLSHPLPNPPPLRGRGISKAEHVVERKPTGIVHQSVIAEQAARAVAHQHEAIMPRLP
jgi:hypothetical protein